MFSYKKKNNSEKIIMVDKEKFIYLCSDNDGDFNKMEFKKNIQPLPRKNIVEKLYISAPSGAGKSTYLGKYLKFYKKMFKKNSVYCFSSVEKDNAIDKYIDERINIDDSLIEDPLKIEDFENSLTIYDDTDTIRDKKLKDVVNSIKAEMIQIGRHYKARCATTSHIISNYKETRQILNECTSITFFPKSGGNYHIKQYLKVYAGLDKKQIEKIININSRWITLYRTYPQYIIWEKGVSTLTEI